MIRYCPKCFENRFTKEITDNETVVILTCENCGFDIQLSKMQRKPKKIIEPDKPAGPKQYLRTLH